MTMPGRNFSSNNYRYGFNGKELDKEVAGTTTYDYGFRIYSPALGKFLSVDPLTSSYPWYTPYQFASNTPITSIDLDGLESVIEIRGKGVIKYDAINKFENETKLQKKAQEVEMIHKVVNWLLPHLIIPSTQTEKDFGDRLSSNEKGEITHEVVNKFLSFNFTESLTSNVDGSYTKILSCTVDINYNLLFGDKTESFVSVLKNCFETTMQLNKSSGDPLSISPKLLEESAKGLEKATKVYNEQYQDLAVDLISDGAQKATKFAVTSAIEKNLLPGVAKTIGARFASIMGFLLDPLEAKAAVPFDINKHLKSQQSFQLSSKVLSSMMFFFLNGNKINFKNEQKLEEKAVSDHPEDKSYMHEY